VKDKCYFYKAQVTKVTDGDTVIADIDVGFGFKTSKTHIRLAGIDTAETRSKDEAIKKKGEEAKTWLKDLIDGKEIYVESQGIDKYGRVLAKIYTLEGVCCNEELVKMGLALRYDGGKKQQELLKG
jgi:micrococcal nuclease